MDAKQVGIEGLSRYGKAAIVAMAYDERFAIGFIGSSGAGGAKLHRRNFGELVENVAGSGEYHWMAGNYLKYAGPLTCERPAGGRPRAGRPVRPAARCSSASARRQVEGGWVDAEGHVPGRRRRPGRCTSCWARRTWAPPSSRRMETALIDGEVAFRQHGGGHTTGPNWPTFLKFADRYLDGPVAEAASAARPRVALTFDDLPVNGALPPGLGRADIARSILGALRARRSPPVYGFVNAKPLDEGGENAEVLRLWRADGHPLANHTFSHMDLHKNTPQAFGQDVLANEATLRTYMGDQDWHWLASPTCTKARRSRSVARRRGSPARLPRGAGDDEFDDWAYNDPYARCRGRNDDHAIEWLAESYLGRAAASISGAQETAKLAYGRDIPHVMLLHVGGFQTVMLPKLLDLLERRGFQS